MNCNELVEVVTDYLEGAMSPSERERLEKHKASCPGCINHVEQMRATLTLLGRVLDDDLPQDSRERLADVFRKWKSDS